MVTQSLFGTTPDGNEIHRFTISNSSGIALNVINYGGIIQSLKTPDRSGVFENIVLGYDTLIGYLNDRFHIGAIAGRFANRIANGKFSIDGESFQLYQNDRGNHLHGGPNGFHRAIWNIEIVSEQAVRLLYVSADGEEGYPGTLQTEITYALTNENELRIDYRATVNKATVLNLVQHSYFNLAGNPHSILDHQLKVEASNFLPVNETMIPTGELRSVKGTPFDFTQLKTVGRQIKDEDTQLRYGNGYDHCWVIGSDGELKHAASLFDSDSGRILEVFTTMPGIHVYSGNFLTGHFRQHAGICLETQNFPDAPNQDHFPSAILRPGEEYESTTIFKFSSK